MLPTDTIRLTSRRSVWLLVLALGVACPLVILAANCGAESTSASSKSVAEPPANVAPAAATSALQLLAYWIGGEWHIDTRWDDGRPFRARGVWAWGPGKRFVTAKTFVIGDDGTEALLCENVFAVAGDHVVNYVFNNDGSVNTAPMVVSDGAVDSIGASEGSTLRQRIKIIEPDRIEWEFLTQKSDGQWQRRIEGIWSRKW